MTIQHKSGSWNNEIAAKVYALEAAEQYQHAAISDVSVPTLLNLTWAIEITNKVNKILAALRGSGTVAA